MMDSKELVAAILAAGVVAASGKPDAQFALEQFGEMKKLLGIKGEEKTLPDTTAEADYSM